MICNIEETFWCAGTYPEGFERVVDMSSTTLGYIFEPSFGRLAQQETTLACLRRRDIERSPLLLGTSHCSR